MLSIQIFKFVSAALVLYALSLFTKVFLYVVQLEFVAMAS